MRALAIALLAAGCFSDRGLAIEVDVGSLDATRVEMFVGNEPCTTDNASAIRCTGIESDLLPRRRLDGTVYFRSDPKTFGEDVHNGKVTFRLQSGSDADAKLPLVVLVGTSTGGELGAVTLHDVTVPAGSTQILKATLFPAGPISPSGTAATTAERFHVWHARNDDQQTCLAIEHWTNGNVMRDLIVPEEDPDCDGILGDGRGSGNECDPAVFESEHPSPDAIPTCFTGMPAQACVLGARGCADVTGMTEVCDPFADRVCVPDAFCTCVGPSAGEACMPRNDEMFDGIPHFHCDVRVAVGGGAVCQSDSDTIALPKFGGSDCGNKPVISGPHLADLAEASDAHKFGDAQLEVSHADKGCTLQFKVSGTHLPGTELGMVKITGASGAMIIPIAVRFVPAPCVGQRLECSFDAASGDDNLWDCAAPR